MADSDSGGSFITGFVLGGVIGAVVGILLAPKAGSETRADLLEQSESLRVRAEELAAKVREQVGPAVESVRERVGRASSKSEADGGPGAAATASEDGGPKANQKA
jgi:gas vesicle protein